MLTDTPHTCPFSCTLHMSSHSHRGSRCLSAHFTPSTCLPWCHLFERAFVVSSCLSLSCFSPTFSLSLSTCSLSGTPASMSSPPRVKTTALTYNEEYRWGFIHTRFRQIVGQHLREKCASVHRYVDCQPYRKLKDNGENGSVALLVNYR